MVKRRAAVLKNTHLASMPATRHYIGTMAANGSIERRRLPVPRVLILEKAFVGRDTGYFLYRFTEEGQPAGDTWHSSESDALNAAVDEFGDRIYTWTDVPDDVEDEVLFALQLAAKM